MEVQKPQEQQLLKKTLGTAAAAVHSNKPPSIAGRLQNPSPPTVPSHPERPGELRKEGDGSGEEEKVPELPAAEAAVFGLSTAVAAGKVAAAAAGAVTDLDKRLRRAERFGMPVQLSEEEKRNSRAERFGTVSTSHGKSEDQKRKARAERFGLAELSSTDDEAKKKARLARFSQDSKTDNLEEEKRKARAIRFSQTTSSVSSQTNSEPNLELKSPAVDKKKGGT